MNRLFVILCFAAVTACHAQSPQIRSGSTVYIEPMDGYETALAAAFMKKHVPVVIVADKAKAEYVIKSEITHSKPDQPAVIVNSTNVNNTTVNSANVNNGDGDAWTQAKQRATARAATRAALGSTSSNISVVDVHSAQLVFAYSVSKAGTTHQQQSAAEACAKHFKEFIAKTGK